MVSSLPVAGMPRLGFSTGRGGWVIWIWRRKCSSQPHLAGRGRAAPVGDPNAPAKYQIVKASPETHKRAFLAVLLVLTAALACLIYRSNSRAGGRVARFSTASGAVSGSAKRFFSGLLSGQSRISRSEARPEDLLELKGIILSRRRPVAMINTTALEAGETASMNLASQEYNILCMDIASDQVRIQADEREPVTLQLKERPQ
jgi:hypothetical protein